MENLKTLLSSKTDEWESKKETDSGLPILESACSNCKKISEYFGE